jgi:hypothetical protein
MDVRAETSLAESVSPRSASISDSRNVLARALGSGAEFNGLRRSCDATSHL